MNHELLAQLEEQRDAHLHMAQYCARQALAIHQRTLPRLRQQLTQLAPDPAANVQRLALVAKIAEMEMDSADECDLLGELGENGALQVVGRANAALATLEDYLHALSTRGLWDAPEQVREIEQQRTAVWQRINSVRDTLHEAQKRLQQG